MDILAGDRRLYNGGTAMADFFDRSLGIGYTGGSSILLACVVCSLAIWYLTLGSINVQTVATPKVGDDHFFTDFRDRARRLDCGQYRIRI